MKEGKTTPPFGFSEVMANTALKVINEAFKKLNP